MKRLSTEIIRFAIVGVLATGIHYGVYLVLERLMAPWIAYTIGYAVSFAANFYLSSRFTFQEKATVKKGIGFMASHAVNYGLHIGLLTLFLHAGIPEEIAPVPVYMIVIPVNFILVRFVFHSKKL